MFKITLKELANNIDTLKEDGLTWEEIAVELNKRYNVSYSESAYRKRYTPYKQGVRDSLTEGELASLMYEYDKKKKQSSIVRSAAKADIRDTSIRDLFYEQIKEKIDTLEPLSIGTDVGVVENGGTQHLFAMGDLHHKGDMDWLNYKIKNITQEIVDYTLDNDLDQVVIVELGDTIDGGSLRPSQLMALKKGMVDQAIEVAEAYSVMLDEIQLRTKREVILNMVTSSNHTELRPLNTSRKELIEEDLMKVIKRFIELRVNNNHITILGEKQPKFTIGDFKFLASHGDAKRMSLPRAKEFVKDLDRYYRYNGDFYIFGHYHHYAEETLNTFEGVDSKVFLIPSLSGNVDTYEENNQLGSRGGFVALVFNEEEGHIMTRHIKV